MESLLPYLAYFGPVSMILALVCGLALAKMKFAGDEDIVDERQISISKGRESS